MSRFTSDPKIPHMIATKRIVKYLKEIQSFGLLFPKARGRGAYELETYSDSDWSGDQVKMKSTSCY